MVKKNTILELLSERVVILDGAMGSLLIDAGLPAGVPSEKWNAEKPEIIRSIHRKYFEAGSDVVLTNTFGGTRIKLEGLKEGNNLEEYNFAAVDNAKQACPEHGYIAGDIGPTGKFLPPVGTATIEDFFENFYEQAKILAKGGVDFFFIETMMDIVEAEAAIKAAKKAANIPVFASITFQKTKRGFFTVMGNSVQQSIEVLEKNNVDVIGVNCTIGSDEMIELIPILRDGTKLPISAKPNAGKPELKEGKVFYPTNKIDFAKDIHQMIKAKVNVVGGCCGTKPQYIQEIAKLLKKK